MTLLRLISTLANESEYSLRKRASRAKELLTGKPPQQDARETTAKTLSGRIFLITTWRKGKGEEDFLFILQKARHRVKSTIRMNWYRHSKYALVHALRAASDQFREGDIVAIIRGGGDTTDKSFEPFHADESTEAVTSLTREKKVVVITGIGHSSDHFCVEQSATFKTATPTDAAYLINSLFDQALNPQSR